MVITGATSGIGLATARMAAKRGTRLVLASRNEDALRQLVDELRQEKTRASYVVADVGDEADIARIVLVAQSEFGGFDTWVNNAGGGIFGSLLEHSMEDSRRLFDTNFWGVVYGSLAAARHLKPRGGAIINVGSVVSDQAVPLQGMYSSSKHAVKGFTDALRMELEAEGAPISVTLIKPTSIDTPFPQHARNYMDEEPSLPPPVYAPHLVAEAILHCAETPKQDVIVGGGGKMISSMGHHAPHLADKVMSSPGFLQQEESGKPVQNPQGALHAPTTALQERGQYEGQTRETSIYTQTVLHPLIAGAVAVSTGLLIAAFAGRKASSGNGQAPD